MTGKDKQISHCDGSLCKADIIMSLVSVREEKETNGCMEKHRCLMSVIYGALLVLFKDVLAAVLQVLLQGVMGAPSQWKNWTYCSNKKKLLCLFKTDKDVELWCDRNGLNWIESCMIKVSLFVCFLLGNSWWLCVPETFTVLSVLFGLFSSLNFATETVK